MNAVLLLNKQIGINCKTLSIATYCRVIYCNYNRINYESNNQKFKNEYKNDPNWNWFLNIDL